MISTVSLPLIILLAQIALFHSQPIPPSPFGSAAVICAQGDIPYSVNGYPGTPHISTPFQDEYVSPVYDERLEYIKSITQSNTYNTYNKNNTTTTQDKHNIKQDEFIVYNKKGKIHSKEYSRSKDVSIYRQSRKMNENLIIYIYKW